MDDRNLDPQGWDVLHKHETVQQARESVGRAAQAGVQVQGGNVAAGNGGVAGNGGGYGGGVTYNNQEANAAGQASSVETKGGAFKVMAIAFGILALGLGGALAVLAMTGSIKMNNAGSGSGVATEKEVATISEAEQKKIVDADAGAEVRALVKEVSEELSGFLEKKGLNYWIPKTFDETVPVYKFDDVAVRTSLERSYGLMADNARLEQIAMAEDGIGAFVKKSLKEKGFTEYAKEEDGFISPDEFFNKESEILCSVDGQSFSWNMSCGHISWISEERKELVNALAEALKKDEDYGKMEESQFSEVYIGADAEDIENGAGEYQRLVGAVDNAAGVFWRKDKDSEWNLFTVTQNGASCDEYKTADLKKAFKGESCRDAASGAEKKVEE
ncbi:hypothetical protein IKF15_03005 [Candidatus Saccharibacteria bacterium]|nr:hypothetical protein [Candidatus Saccharibacteria bacterium]